MSTATPFRGIAMAAGIVGSLTAARAEEVSVAKKIMLDEHVAVEIGPPIVVAAAPPGEKRWGFTQFPTLSKLPGGQILCMFSNQADAVAGYGNPVPGYVSQDGGLTWRRRKAHMPPRAAPHGVVSEVLDGEFLCMPPVRALDTRKAKIDMPAPIGRCGRRNVLYRLADCAAPVKTFATQIDAVRWMPKTKTWQAESVRYDKRLAILWARADGPEQPLVARTWFERPLLAVGKELLYADYRQLYVEPDGHVPKNMAVSCMVSGDNGRSFTKRATIAIDRTGKVLHGEPMLAPTADGRLACIMRRQRGTSAGLMPMAIAFSKDVGRTWTKPTPLKHRGVFPALVLMDCGVMALAYGRPGVHLLFSLDGKGRRWTDPILVRKGDAKQWFTKSCGYTAIAPLDANRLLLAYSDFEHRGKDGTPRKTILVRRVTLHPGTAAQ